MNRCEKKVSPISCTYSNGKRTWHESKKVWYDSKSQTRTLESPSPCIYRIVLFETIQEGTNRWNKIYRTDSERERTEEKSV